MLGTLTTRRRWVWITGNHDAALVDHCGGEIMDEAEVAGLVLRHEAVPGETRPELSRHFPPKLRMTLRGRRVARRCFLPTGPQLNLPADRKSGVKGQRGSVRVIAGGRRIIKKK